MTSNQIVQQIKDSLPILQASLDRGWQEFQQSYCFTIGEQFSNQINWWYNSQFYNVIPNPAHWYAAQLSAQYFLAEIRELNLYFDTIYPGDFSTSVEFVREDGLDVRRFMLNAFYLNLNSLVCIFQLDFIHHHEQFYFTYPPQLSIFDPIEQTSDEQIYQIISLSFELNTIR